MASQTLIFVLLPNGITAKKTLALSVYLTPRLDKGATLAAFPDILNWTSLIQSKGLKFDVSCAGKTTTFAANQAVLRPEVWKAIFTPTTFVEAYTLPDFDQRVIISYPVRDAMSYFKYAYQAIGSGTATTGEGRRNPLETVLEGLVFRDGKESTLAAEISALRVTLWNEQQQLLNGGTGGAAVQTATAGIVPPVPPDGIPTTLTAPANTHDTMTRFAAFHSMPPAPNRPPLPQTEADFAKTLDFHRALTTLNSYPTLLRALGLVFDIELPANFCPASPAGGAYGSVQISKVTPGFKWSLLPTFSFPATSYVSGNSSFQAAPASQAGATTILPGDVANGFLALTPDSFHLLQVDVDGGLLKTLTVADNLANASDATVVGDDLPSMRSGGVGLVANGRGLQLLESIVQNKGFNDALSSNAALPRPFNARDLTRGFRIDIWSSRKQQWFSLHRRNSTYRFGPSGSIVININDEEGFLQPAAAQPADDPTRGTDQTSTENNIPQPGTDLYVHERLARWDGWSLSASRPGLALNRSPDPAEATTPDPTLGEPLTPFKMTTSFAAAPGTLPELRFGVKYRLRARAVDLAGNSVSLKATAANSLIAPANGASLPYLRFEPVNPPLLILQQPVQPGAALERMVIRSANSSQDLDSIPTAETDHRHVAPPRIAERMAEHHGLFDDPPGKLKGDAATFSMITQRDRFAFPTSGDVPLDPSPLVNVGYLPDVLSRGAALRNLPNTPDDTNGRLVINALTYKVLPDVQTRPGSVTFIDFGTQWPQRTPFLLTIVEGTAPPAWDAANRVLTVSLPKAAEVDVDLSSYLFESDLMIMGAWAWLREYFTAREIAAMQSGVADAYVSAVTDLIALLTRLVLEGGHSMLTPSRTVTLVHAVQQPLGRPQFVQLPVMHRVTKPIFASALRNSFTPITAWRSVGSHNAALLGALEINGASTSKIELLGRWLEYTDDPSKPAPTKTWQSSHVETLPLPTTDAGVLYSDATNTRMVGTYIPRVDALWFSVPIDDLDGVSTPFDVAAPLHRFDDTKHRWVGYTAVATTRFQEYFVAGLDFTRSSEPLLVDVPSSARPVAPDIAYVVPTFGWERQETSNVKSSVRFGNGLRVYLERPWYSSGDSELLGVVLWNGTAPDYPTREQYKALFTQWGNDPVWETGSLNDVPGVSDFSNAFATAQALALEESPKLFDVAGHQVQFDQQRGLWYCDIEFYNSTSYMPFVRLALARYQPHSIQGVELSRVVLADYAQLTTDRSCVISIDPSDTRRAQIFVGGVAPQAPMQSVIDVSVEQRLPNVISDIAWEVAPTSVVQINENTPDATEPDAVLWSGNIVFAKNPPAGQFRVVVREYERIQIDPPPSADGVATYGERLVYAAIVNYDYPSGS
jgi:hypothetical protein